MGRVPNGWELGAMWIAFAVLVISIFGVVVIRACVAVGMPVLVWPALVAVLLLFAAVWMVYLALRPEDDYEPPEMPWYTSIDVPPRARGESTGAAGPYVARRAALPRSQQTSVGDASRRVR